MTTASRRRTALRTALSLAAALLALPTAAAPIPQPVTPEARWFHVGALAVASLHDGDFLIPNDAKTFGTDAGVAAVAALLTANGAPADTITVSINTLLVRDGRHLVLIDSGIGPAMGVLVKSLAAAGVRPDQITDVLITHSHGDHVGGLVDAAGKPAFANAKVRMSAAEWTWLRANTDAARLVAAIAPQVVPFAPGAEVVPGITSVPIAGHTPGHSGYRIVSGSADLLDIGDTAHSTIVSLQRPAWIMGFDSDPAVGRASREAELARLAASHERIFAPHFPYPGVGTVAAKGDGYVWVPAAAL